MDPSKARAIDDEFESKIEIWKSFNNQDSLQSANINHIEAVVEEIKEENVVTEQDAIIKNIIVNRDDIELKNINLEEQKIEYKHILFGDDAICNKSDGNEISSNNNLIINFNNDQSYKKIKLENPSEATYEYKSKQDEEITQDASYEIVFHLTNKIESLIAQIENYKKTIETKDSQIISLKRDVDVLKHDLKLQNDGDYIESQIKRGLEIINELRNIHIPEDKTKENYLLSLENLRMKSIVEELTGRIKLSKKIE